ncbi:receptor-type tyrosine-protein phosphatase T-like [Asterias rubens]|uniref:receptor-type tyrosine-protein phosphatase T-like n=1 Tax=Asterias rubens TaxID=7604 RepID=UPI0014559559|nr:receptor-type tyrosine-protein phosphatase T-like [Asterias rubens]XP_033636579.1 receptor-type tyrosine-protein phosphatase T-like [Asterias rubens]
MANQVHLSFMLLVVLYGVLQDLQGHGCAAENREECSFEPQEIGSYSNEDVTLTNPNIYWQKVSCDSSDFNIENYTLRIAKPGTDDNFEDLVKVEGATSVNLTLSPCTSYSFKVAAELRNRTGPYSFELFFATSPKGPDAVANLTNQIESDNLTMSWTAPGTNPANPCNATGYLLTYELIKPDEHSHGQNDFELARSLNTNDTAITIDGLKENSTYRVNVTSTNSAGVGGVVSVIVTIGNKAGPVNNIEANATDSSLTFFWDPVSDASRYQYNFKRDDGNEMSTNFTPYTNISFLGLSPCTSYSFSVKAFTSKTVSSTWTKMINQRTSKIAPGSVTMLQAVHLSATKINITWQLQNDTNRCADDYAIGIELLNLDQCNETSKLTQEETEMSPTTITELYPHSTYRFHVRASNDLGLANETSIEVTTSGSEPSGPPIDLKATSATNNTVTFSWNQPPCGQRNGNVTTYQLSIVNTADGSVSTRNISRTTETFTGLVPFTDYNLSVSAVNQFGSGPFASAVNRTLEGKPSKPVSLVASHVGQKRITLQWNEPQFPNGRIQNYTIEHRVLARPYDTTFKFDLYSAFTVQGVVDLSSLEAVIADLEPSTQYELHIWAVNHAGIEGQKERLDVYTKTATAGPVNNIGANATDSSLTFFWDPVSYASRYQYNFKRDDGNVMSTNFTPYTNISFLGLSPCTSYSFSVKAFTSKTVSSMWTEMINQRTSKIAPGSVTMLQAVHLSATKINITWQLPNDTNRCANDYAIDIELLNLDQCNETSKLTQKETEMSPTTITELYPHSTYRFHVRASNDLGLANETSIEVTTSGSEPSGPPIDLKATSVTNNTMTFSWNQPPCGQRNGNVTTYQLSIVNTADGSVSTRNISCTTETFTGLVPFTDYNLSVSAVNQFGSGPFASAVNRTLEGKPSKPVSLVASHVGQKRITLQWNEPQFPYGRIQNYTIEHRVLARPYDTTFKFDLYSAFTVQEVVDLSSLEAVIADLEPSTQYELHIWAVNHAGIEGQKERLDVYTKMATDFPAPQKPTLIAEESTVSSIAIGLLSKSSSIYVSHYQIGVRKIKDTRASTGKVVKRAVPEFRHHDENPSAYVAAELPGRLPGKFVVGDNKTYGRYWNPPLQEGAVYEIYVGGVSRINETMANVEWNSDPLVVQVDGDYSDYIEPGSSVLVVGIIFSMSFLIVLILLVLLLTKKRRTARTKSQEAETKSDLTSNIQVELQVRPSTHQVKTPAESSTRSNDDTVGEDEVKSTSQSATVMAQTTYVLSEETSKPGPSASPKHNQKKPKLKSKNAKAASVSRTEPVAMAELTRFIKTRKSGKINGFQQDFETLPVMPTHPHATALIHENKVKNRYTNIPAYDHSRVLLETIEGLPHSDYINASYIDGYKHEAKYIACQGPNQTSVNDMWRMIWQEQVGKIVMLTNLVEKGKEKCVQYWPDEGSCDYGEIFVRHVSEEKTLNFVIRTFNVAKSSEPEGEYREVLQYHYITWPDMKPPESSSLLEFVRRLQATQVTSKGPIVVHCSAGVGRTGTYIALDAMLEQARAEGQVDVLNFVREMRDKRYLMVQTIDQFKFIYEALLESSLSENTAISVDRFQQDLTKLKKRDKKTGTDGIKDQFKMLETFTASMSDDQCCGGRQPDNADKNRFEDCIPRDSTRPYLMTDGGEGSTNYINAAFLDGFSGKHSYLATQAPLPTTIGDIWRMVFDYKSPCIVLLNSMDNDLSIPQYWPEEGSMSFGPLTVELLSVDQLDEDMVVRQFGIVNTVRNKDDMQTVCHIQFLQWPSGKDVPNSPSSLLKVLETVKTWRKGHPDGPLTVQCIDGEGCSGTFCTLVTLLDRLEQDGVIDVFQAVKKLRSTRAGMVKTLAQYQLCYQVMTWYLESASGSSIYENLRR